MMNRSVALCCFSFLIVLTSGCTDLNVVPPTARLSCEASEDCPAGFVCRDIIGECVADEALADAPIVFVIDPAVERSPLSAVGPQATTQFTAQLSAAPSRLLEVSVDGTKIECAEGRLVSCVVDAEALGLEGGSHVVTLVAMDRAGNELRGAATFDVDDQPPRLVSTPLIRIQPSFENLQSAPTALGRSNLALLNVTMTFDEILDAAPQVTLAPLSPDGAALPLLLVSTEEEDQVTFSYNLILLDDTVEEGEREIIVDATDRVGNRAVIETGSTVTLDVTPPPSPQTDTPDQIVFERQPWGSAATDFRPTFRVRGEAGAFESGALVLARVSDAEDSLVVGRGNAAGDGSIELDLLPVDVARVTLFSVDSAGNVSAPAVTKDIEWTASMGGKIPYSTFENPHRFFESISFDGITIAGLLEDESQTLGRLLDAGAAPLTTKSVSSFTALTRGDATGTPHINLHAVAYHLGRGSIFVHGGGLGFVPDSNLTYEIVDDVWTLVDSDRKPPVGESTMTYDAANDRLLCVVANETWVLEGRQWRQLFTGTPVLPNAKLAYDPVRGYPVLTNGEQVAYFDDDDWILLEYSPDAPPLRRATAWAYNPVTDSMMLYGGILDGTPHPAGDRWRLDWIAADETYEWTRLSDAPPRANHQLVWDSVQDRLLLLGFPDCRLTEACAPEDAPTSGVLVYRPETESFEAFSNFDIETLNPGAVFDPVKNQLVWIGGFPNFAINAGAERRYLTMNAEGEVEDRLAALAPLARRHAHTGFFDPGTNEVLFLRGETASGDTVEESLDGVVLTDTGGRPLAAAPVIFGGGYSQFFFDGTTTAFIDEQTGQWIRRVGDGWTQSPSNGVSSRAALAYFPPTGAVIAFGGDENGGTSTTLSVIGGVATTIDTPTAPPPRQRAIAVYDPDREAILVFGGFLLDTNGVAQHLYADTWAFDGTDWTLLVEDEGPETFGPILSPYDRTPTIFYHAQHQRPMLWHGGSLYGFTETGWTEFPFLFPERRDEMAMVYDPNNDRIVAHGGIDALFFSVDALDILDNETANRPAHLFDVDLGARRSSDDSRILDVTVRAQVGGRGYLTSSGAAFGEGQDGADVRLWSGAWTTIASTTASPSAPTLVTATVDAELLPRSFDERLRLALTSTVGQGPLGPQNEGAEVATKAVEVVVRYRE